MQQQQNGHYSGPFSGQIASIVSMFKQCGGRSEDYQAAVKELPASIKPHLLLAIHGQVRLAQQQQQQLQL